MDVNGMQEYLLPPSQEVCHIKAESRKHFLKEIHRRLLEAVSINTEHWVRILSQSSIRKFHF